MNNKVLLVISEVIDNFMDNYNKLDAQIAMKDLMSEIESKCVKETKEERMWNEHSYKIIERPN